MNDDEFESFCETGRSQREVTWGQPMLPILFLLTDHGNGIFAITGPSEEWPTYFDRVRQEQKPTGAILTGDTFVRFFEDEEPAVRPESDPEAVEAVVVADSDGRCRVMPYSVTESGPQWHEPRDSIPELTPILDALRRIVP